MTLIAVTPLMAVEKPVNDRGVFTLQLGAGFGPNTLVYGVYPAAANQGYFVIPPLTLSGNFGIIDLVSVGFLFAYEACGFSNPAYTAAVHTFMIGARSDFHFNRWIKVRRLDIYAGATFGVSIYAYSGTQGYAFGAIPNTVGFLWNVQAGARYYVAENFGFWGEVGYGYSIVSAGIIFRF